MSRLVHIEHTYEVDAGHLWRSCVSYDDLKKTMAGLIKYQGLPDGELTAGQSIEITVDLPLFVPKMPWWIEVIERDDTRCILKTSERGGSIKSYLHTMTVRDEGQGVSSLIDHIEFDAGWLSGPMSLWIGYMYRARNKPRRRLLGLPR